MPDIGYDAIFYLENIASLQQALRSALGDFELSTFAPHSRSAQDKINRFYTPHTIELVRHIYARDFETFHYSRDIGEATEAPGAYWKEEGPSPLDEEAASLEPAAGWPTLKPVIRYHQLIEARLI